MKKYIQNFKLLMFPIYIVSDSVGNLMLSNSCNAGESISPEHGSRVRVQIGIDIICLIVTSWHLIRRFW